jgi:hypothetical protein
MSELERRLALSAVVLFSVVVILWGLSGVFFTSLWLDTLLRLPLHALDATGRATFGCEFRFLEARELGVGLFSLALREEIVSSRKHNLVFLAVVYAAPLARTWSLVASGQPSLVWLMLFASEVFMAVVLTVLTRKARAS